MRWRDEENRVKPTLMDGHLRGYIDDTGDELVRVQVKSTGCRCEDRYAIAAHGSNPRVAYTKEEIDSLVAFIVPEDTWYIIPVEAFTPRTHLWLYPRGEHAGQYEQYREAWHLLGVAETAAVK